MSNPSDYWEINSRYTWLTAICENKRWRIPKGQSKIDNPEKLPTQGTQDDEKQNKNIKQYVLDTTMHKQTQIT